MKALVKFHQELVAIYGYGLQVSTALQFWNKWLDDQVSSASSSLGNYVSFGPSNPNDPDATFVYRRSFGYLLDASGMNGETFVTHRKNLVILLYASWDDHYRQEIAREAGLKTKNDLTSDVFGDVRAYRHAIVHANGKLQSVPKVFCFFSKGQELDLTDEHLNVIFRIAVDECNQLGRRLFGIDPKFSFEEPLNTMKDCTDRVIA